MIKPHLNDPCGLKPSDLEAHAVLDDDGNPHHPLDPEPETTWRDALEDKLHAATRMLDQHAALSMAIALCAGYVIGRLLAARAS